MPVPGCDQLCGPGTTSENGICVSELSCGPGTVDVDGACVCTSPCADADADGVCDEVDVCPADPGNDADGDGLCAADDPCPDNPDADCTACQLDSDWEEIDAVSLAGTLPFRGRFAQHPTTGEIWLGYTRFNTADFTDTSSVVERYDEATGAFVEEDVLPLGGRFPSGLDFDPSGNLWVTAAIDGHPLLRVRATDGTWSSVDVGDLEPDQALSAAPRNSVLVDDDLWMVGDTCLGPSGTSGTGDELRAYLIVWKYSTADGTVQRVELPMTMVGNLNDGTPINLSNQGVVSCRRTFPSRIVARPDGKVWVVGGMSSWDDPSDPTDDTLIRSESFVYEGDMTGFIKILEHRPADYRSDESFSDAVVVGDTVYLGHSQRSAAGQQTDWRILAAPLSDLSNLTELDHFTIEPGTVDQMDQADDLLYHPPSMQVFASGNSADSAGQSFGVVRVGDLAGFSTSLVDDTPDGFNSFTSQSFLDADHNIWSSTSRFDAADFDPGEGIIRRLRCE
ncbi:MAG: hypothetical protein AAF721_03380 [Myxococcota bacterium]